MNKKWRNECIFAVWDTLGKVPFPIGSFSFNPAHNNINQKGFHTYADDMRIIIPKCQTILYYLMFEEDFEKEEIKNEIKDLEEYIQRRKQENWD